jgi:HPt (histidine-containing phosphotransfer) domain-containing protein
MQLDLPTLRRNCVDDLDLIRGVLGEVLRLTPSRIDRLTSAAKNEDASMVHGEAHRMKGSFKTIGALALGEICEQIELATERGEISLLQSDFHALQSGYAELVNEIESFLAVGEVA